MLEPQNINKWKTWKRGD